MRCDVAILNNITQCTVISQELIIRSRGVSPEHVSTASMTLVRLSWDMSSMGEGRLIGYTIYASLDNPTSAFDPKASKQ